MASNVADLSSNVHELVTRNSRAVMEHAIVCMTSNVGHPLSMAHKLVTKSTRAAIWDAIRHGLAAVLAFVHIDIFACVGNSYCQGIPGQVFVTHGPHGLSVLIGYGSFGNQQQLTGVNNP